MLDLAFQNSNDTPPKFHYIIFMTKLSDTTKGLIFFNQLPDYLSFIGYGIIILMALINFLYNKKQADEKSAVKSEENDED